MMSEYAQRQQDWASGCGSHHEPTEREKASTQRMIATARAAAGCTCTQQSEWRETPYAADCPQHGYILPDGGYIQGEAQAPSIPTPAPRQRTIASQTVYQAVERLAAVRRLLARGRHYQDMEALDTVLAYVRTVSGLGGGE